jgi:hypothetical protein
VQQEEERRSIEEKEKDRKIKFMEDWKEKVERKRKQERVQQGWKDLLESVEQWEELQEGETDFTDANLEEWFDEEWTEEGFQEAGEVLETVLSEVMAFIEMSGTVQAKNYHHQQKADKAKIELSSESEEMLEQLEASRASGTILNEKEKGLFIGTVPSDRVGELEEIQK